MTRRKFRVIQWATGTVGTVALRHFAENPNFELVGVWVSGPDKDGKDAGTIAGITELGVIATTDVEYLIGLDADCVHFAPAAQDIPLVCRLLRSGKNVVSPLGPHYRTERFRADWEAIDEACKVGGTSFHGAGIHPGFAGDLLPLTMARVMDRIDHIHVYEVVDFVATPSNWIAYMGFGRAPEDVLANPSRPPEAPNFFAQSMAMVLESLGCEIDDLTTTLNLTTATAAIPYPGGLLEPRTVAGQHYVWTAWSEGKARMTFHCFWVMGQEHLADKWDVGASGYRVRFEGSPPLEVTVGRPSVAAGAGEYPGGRWTAMAGVNAIVAVCKARPGMVTHMELGLYGPPGLIRD